MIYSYVYFMAIIIYILVLLLHIFFVNKLRKEVCGLNSLRVRVKPGHNRIYFLLWGQISMAWFTQERKGQQLWYSVWCSIYGRSDLNNLVIWLLLSNIYKFILVPSINTRPITQYTNTIWAREKKKGRGPVN